jgi:hypothetical protein
MLPTTGQEYCFMDNDNIFMTYLLEGGSCGDPLEEILNLARIIHPQIDIQLISQVHRDITCIFSGIFPGFRASNPTYHNLRHTRQVALASVRLLHGLWCEGRSFSAETLIQGLLSAYFHDTGMLLSDGDTAKSGSQYFRGHEERSITFIQRYIASSRLPDAYKENCAAIVRCTNLNLDPDQFSFPNEEIKLAGQVIGSADILAQMADRYYLERLPLLFQEQKDGEDHRYNSPIELMKHTTQFYHTTVTRRLRVAFADVSRAMRSHFREYRQIDEDLYAKSIEKNITYLESIIARCAAEHDCVKRYLRRVTPE